MSDYDNPWKDALDRWFEEFLDFFFPAVHRHIDWQRDANLRHAWKLRLVRG